MTMTKMGSTAAAHPLVMVEVTPLIVTNTRVHRARDHKDGDKSCLRTSTHPSISIPSAKLQLLNMSRRGLMSTGWLDAGVSSVHANSGTNNKQTRGLRLKVNLPRGTSCQFCQGRVQPSELRVNRTGDATHPNHHNSYQTIVSGDLVFQGNDEVANKTNKESIQAPSMFVTNLQSDDPLEARGVPCQLRGYIIASRMNCPSKRRCYCQPQGHSCLVTSGTAVYICPPLEVSYDRGMYIMGSIRRKPNDFVHTVLSGTQRISGTTHVRACFSQSKPSENDIDKATCSESILQYSKLSCYNEETVQSLSLRMSSMLANTVWIGTTQHALSKRSDCLQKNNLMRLELDAFWGRTHTDVDTTRGGNSSSMVPLLLREGALLVHNSHPNSGKSTLVEAVAIDVLKCNAVHRISAPALIAKYGINADAAFESMLHELAVRCAVNGGDTILHEQQTVEIPKLCIILDHFESFLPLSSQTTGDPYLPVLNGMGKFSEPQ